MQQLSPRDRITRARAHIMRDKRFIAMAGIMMIGTWDVSETVPTAATNGRDVMYGRKFIEDLNDAQLRFLILHEYYHIMLMQLSVWKHLWDKDKRLANIAADYVVNVMLDKLAGSKADRFLEFIEGGCLDYQYNGMDTGEVFRRLQEQQQQQQQGQQGQGGEPLDEHDLTGTDLPEIGEEEMQALKQQVDTTLRQAVQLAGKMGASIDRSITDLLDASVPWQEQLQDFLKTTAAGNDLSTWRRPSRRWLAQDIYMPSRYSESAKRITIGIDTSGSINEQQLRRALTEVKGACEAANPETVDLIYWDSAVAAHETYDSASLGNLVNATKPKGGGGTRVVSMKRYMQARDIKPDCIIVFTDGYVERDWGGNDWPAPVLWCISTKGITAPHGKSLYVPAEHN